MNICSILQSNANVQFVVSGADLKEFAESIFKQCKECFSPEKPAETYYTTAEVADMLGVSKPTLWRWARTGYLCPLKVGSKVRYKHSDVLRIKGEI